MSSFYAELTLAGSTYPVRQCEFGFSQATDGRGRVQAKVRHGLLHLTLDVPDTDQLPALAQAAYKP
ncbi:MAG: type VI secretion system tube protein TssD [Janthinobacterium lividum]